MSAVYTHDPAPPAVAKITGSSELYPVRRIFCVGRNYAAHAREMGKDPERDPPFFFTKSADALVETGGEIAYPPGTSNYHYEMELVVALSGPLFEARVEETHQAIFGYASGLDMTRRDLQLDARDKGRPWDLGKSFEESAILGPIVPMPGHVLDRGRIALSVDGNQRQLSDLSLMLWSVPEILSVLSNYYHLGAGDLIFTGTPEGIGAVHPGEAMRGEIDGLPPVEARIGPAQRRAA